MQAAHRMSILLAVAVLAAGCAVNSTREGGDDALMLQGYDPVSYFGTGGPVSGSREFRANYEGRTYRFASAANKAEFERNPVRYVPQYGGFCANGLVYAIKSGGDPRIFQVVGDRLFIFGGNEPRRYFAMDLAKNIVLADRYWQGEAKDTPAGWQNFKRRVFQVPHYKTDAELAAELKRREAGASKS